MNWKELDAKSGYLIDIDSDRRSLLEKVKKEGFPIVQRESEQGVKSFRPIVYQPVRSTGRFEAEFGVKDEDIVFHFWPWGYHEAQKDGRYAPRFSRIFESHLKQAMDGTFDANRIEINLDEDMGAFFVRARSYGSNQFHRELSIKVCQTLHELLGGS